MDEKERKNDIDYWWTDAIGNSFDYGNERRVHLAFRHVLLALPDKDFEHFMEQRPLLLCLPQLLGKTFRRLFPIPPGAEPIKVNFIYLSPNIDRWSEKNLVNTIAHEIAHLVLGHQDIRDAKHKPRSETEAEADALSKKWGFGPSYTKSRLRQLKARETR